jgi:hypothetical protein
MGTAAVLVAVLLVVTLVVQGIPGRDDPAAAPAGAAPTPTATRTPAGRAGSTQSSVQAPAPRLTWPLPRSCYRAVSRGRAVTASDRRQLGGEGLVVAAYGVEEGQLGDLRSGKAQACHTLTWRLVRHLYPPAALSLVSRFIVFEPPPRGSRSTSGRTTGRTIGFVSTRDASLRRWTLAVSIQDLDDDLFAHTLVHELGHLLSLGPRQLTAGGSGSSCRTWATGEGCARPGSLLDGYVGRTWSPSLLREWRAAQRIRRDSARERALDAFYERHRSRFVGPYAATDPDEDFAESFAFWCLGRTPTSPPFVSRSLRAKAAFMTGRSELRGMRERCRSLR